MKRFSLSISIVLVTGLIGSAVAAGCGEDETASPAADAGNDSPSSQPDTSTPDTGTPPPADGGTDGAAAILARGKYMVDVVAACGDCHTPRKPDGSFDMTKYLAGADCFIDVDPTPGVGCISSANLTNDPTGLKNRSDADIKAMLTTGKRPDGKNLASVMPYFVFANLKPADVDAMVAYLRTVPAVAHTAQANEAPFDNVPVAATAIDPTSFPPVAAGANENGRYLASIACIDCHTPELTPPSARPIDMTRPFAGGRPFRLGLPNPPFPDTIYTANITQHSSGIEAYSAAEIQRVLKTGRDRTDGGVCPPMPTGPMGAFGQLTDSDSLDIANYIKGLPGIDNTVPNGCQAP